MSTQAPNEYGMVVYDIPQGCQALYHRIWTRLRKYGIRINLSVYLIPWGYRSACQDLIEEAMEKSHQKATFSILKYDEASRDDLEDLAREQLNREVIDTMRRLSHKAQECLESGKDISPAYLKIVHERLDTAKALSVVFGLTGAIEASMLSALSVFDAQAQITQLRKQLKDAHIVPESAPTPKLTPVTDIQGTAYVCSPTDDLVPLPLHTTAADSGTVCLEGIEGFTQWAVGG